MKPWATLSIGILGASALLIAACGPPVEPLRGGPGQLCYPNATCDEGLLCVEGLCHPGDGRLAGLPRVTVTRGPAPFIAERDLAVHFHCDLETCVVACALDGDVIPDCESPLEILGLDDGTYLLILQAEAADGRLGPATSVGWVVDTRPPAATILSAPPAYVAGSEVAFALGCDEPGCTYECVLNADDPVSCGSEVTYADLPDGDYLFGARAVDRAENAGEPAYHAFRIDTRPPVAAFTETPPDPSRRDEAIFVFEADEPVHFRCRLDEGPWLPCDSPLALAGLEEGDRRFEVRAVDRAGNEAVEPLVHAWRVDLTPPRTTIVAAPDPVTAAGPVTFAFEADEPVTFVCSLDEQPWSACESPVTLDGLSSASWLFKVRATDTAGNVETLPAVHGFAVAAPWETISPGFRGNLGIRSDGTLWSWGFLGWQMSTGRIPVPVRPDLRWRAAAAGLGHACAITVDGIVWCWGENSSGQATGTPTGSVVPPTPADLDGQWTEVAVGRFHTCGLREDQTLWCWGSGADGRLGQGDTSGVHPPTQVGDGDDWMSLAVGDSHACGLREGGRLYCWGRNDSGAVGDGTTTSRSEPVAIAPDATWLEVAAGNDFTCARRDDGEILCWGGNGAGRLGIGDANVVSRTSPSPLAVDGPWAALHIGGHGHHACASREGGAPWCWGSNDDGQLGDGTEQSRAAPVPVLAGRLVSAVWTGGRHTCAEDEVEGLVCWGRGIDGQLGRVSVPERSLDPRAVEEVTPSGFVEMTESLCAIHESGALWCWDSGLNATVIELPAPVRQASTRSHRCAVTWDGALWCWGGNNGDGQIGDGTQTSRPDPVRIAADIAWAGVATGDRHTCGLSVDGAVWCWGNNEHGQVSPAADRRLLEPVRVEMEGRFVQVAVDMHRASCAVREDGVRFCWGNNQYGNFGNGSTVGGRVPTPIDDGGGWTGIALANAGACGLRDDRLFCWGGNWDGQVGIGVTGGNVLEPREVGDGGWWRVYADDSRTCASRLDGSLWCWGYASPGWGLGDGTVIGSNRPRRVAGGDVWTASSTYCALRLDGAIRCWGSWGSDDIPVPWDVLASYSP